jgi:hypothetical protein
MTTARRLRGLDTIRHTSAAVQPAPCIHVLYIDDMPRTRLTAREVAAITAVSYDRLLDEINAGRIRADRNGQAFVIPVSELAVIDGWAERLDPTA